MFNRSLKVSVVKDKKSDEPTTSTPTLTEYAATARYLGKDVVVGAGVLIGTYIACDTARQIAVAIVKAKV